MYVSRTLEIPPKGLTLITESGYLMLVKPFSDKLSWRIQRELVTSYFKVRKSEPTLPQNLLATAKPPARMVTDIPDNRQAQALMEEIRQAAAALTPVIELYDRYLPENEAAQYHRVIVDLGMKLNSACFELRRVRLNLVEASK